MSPDAISDSTGTAAGTSSEPAAETTSASADVDDATRRANRHLDAASVAQVALLVLPVVVVIVAGWQKRLIVDDGFIYFRVVRQVVAGHGPVFNTGERVEVYTSPIWLGALVVGRLLFGWMATTSQIAVIEGIGCMATAIAFAELGATRLAQAIRAAIPTGPPAVDHAPPRVWFVPAGVIVLVAFPPTWHYATTGLDASLTVAWISVSFFIVAAEAHRAITDQRGTGRRATARLVVGASIVGSGWLVRPDAIVMSLPLLAVLILWLPSRRSRFIALVAGLLPSVLYEVFRMGYFASLLPSTALTKEAGQEAWDTGWSYLDETVATYSLRPILVLLAILLGLSLVPLRGVRRHERGLRWRLAAIALAPVLGALLHGLWVVRVGGDYFHARFLLPTLFAFAVPVGVVAQPVAVDGVRWLRTATTAATAGIVVLLIGWSVAEARQHGLATPDELGKQPRYMFLGTSTNATEIDDYPLLAATGDQLRARTDRGENVLFDVEHAELAVETPPSLGTIGYFGSIGAAGDAASIDTRIVDQYGLTDPIGSRLPVTGILAGHQKEMPFAFASGRFALLDPPPDSEEAAFRRALRCGEPAELIDATDEPMTVGRFFTNVVRAPRLTSLRIPNNGFEVEKRFCPGS